MNPSLSPARALRRVSFLTLGLLSAAAFAETLIVVEDRGGVPALPYYQALQPRDAAPARSSAPQRAPRLGHSSNTETAMLPVRSALLSPGNEPARVIRVPGLTPLFLVGDDEHSRLWLKQKARTLRELGAFGLVVDVASPLALAELRRLAPGVNLSPVSGDDLALRLGLRHYPALITATGIEP